MPKKTDTDWHAIEADFRAGALSNRQIAKKHGVAESTLRKRIASGGWVRTSAQKVRKNTKTAHQPAHNPQRNPAPVPGKPPSTGRGTANNLDERTENLVSRLLGEVEDTTAHLGEISEAIELETASDNGSRRRDAMLKAISTKERAETVRTLKQIQMMGVTGSGKKKGVKEERREAAEKAASGKFSRMADVVEMIDQSGKLAMVGLDPAGVAEIVFALHARGIEQERIVGISQGWKMTGAIKTLERKLADGTFSHGARPIMAWAVGNAKAQAKGNNIEITKQMAGGKKIDPLMALFDAVACMSRNPEPPGNIDPFLEGGLITT